jgi:hypothetical protein
MGRGRFGQPVRRVTFVRDSLLAQVTNVEAAIDSVGGETFVLTFNGADDRYNATGGFGLLQGGGSYQSPTRKYTHSDMVMIALRAIVLGEEPPPDPFLRSTLPTDFRALYQTCDREATVFPRVAQLVIVERAFAEGIVANVLHASVEHVRRRQAQVTLSAMLPQFYSNAEPEIVEVVGAIQLP